MRAVPIYFVRRGFFLFVVSSFVEGSIASRGFIFVPCLHLESALSGASLQLLSDGGDKGVLASQRTSEKQNDEAGEHAYYVSLRSLYVNR